jgi:methionine sulfoxide reductase heme-binding subunit
MKAARTIKRTKLVIFLTALVPFAMLLVRGVRDELGANPIEAITDVTGTWTLRFVLITLAVTPLRRLTGWNPLIRFRRMLGLFAFFYGCLHFLTWLVLDQFFGWTYILADIAKRPFITVGFLAFVSMIPLALTSTAGSIRRLGGKRWQMLHRLIYVTGIAGVVHYWWLVKADVSQPAMYATMLSIVLGARVWHAVARRRAAPGRKRREEIRSTKDEVRSEA